MLHRFIIVISGGEVPLGVLDAGNAAANPKTGAEGNVPLAAIGAAGTSAAILSSRKRRDGEPDGDDA
jgi:LPXTG-motif cell wall-anchored protein